MLIDEIEITLAKIRHQKPLILCLTNDVTVDFVANSLLAIGAAPIISRSKSENTELLKSAAALYINIGTLNDIFMEQALEAAATAAKLKLPMILDPVGCGASNLRTTATQKLLPFAQCVRGNSNEILAASNNNIHHSFGVEASFSTDKAEVAAKALSTQHQTVVMVSGKIDYLTNGIKSSHIAFGAPLMQKVTGMGCSLTAIIAAFCAVEVDHYRATTLAGYYFALCGQIAAQQITGPASFKAAFIDQLYQEDFILMKQIYNQNGEIDAV